MFYDSSINFISTVSNQLNFFYLSIYLYTFFIYLVKYWWIGWIIYWSTCFLQSLIFNAHVYRKFMSHKYTLIEILLISNMKSVLLYDSYFNKSKGGGGGPESSPAILDPSTWSIQQGLSRFIIFKILILPISHTEDAMLNSSSASSCYQLAKSLSSTHEVL